MPDKHQDIELIALNKLSLDPKNVRSQHSSASLKELVASVEHKGILQNLIVRPDGKKGHYLVTAGGRRFAALKLLLADKKIPATYKVPVRISDEENAEDVSLTENLLREAMHPMDEFEAFSHLEKKGIAVKEIAKRYGTTNTIVKKRLSLARVAPELIELYRKDELGLEALQAFTLTDDHTEQMRVFNELPSYGRGSHSIRTALTDTCIPATNKRIQFLGGLDVYKAAGGAIKCDLFDDDSEGFALDASLVNKLTQNKLDALADTLKLEGWSWVKTAIEYDHEDTAGLSRCYPRPREYTDSEEAEIEQIKAKLEELEEAHHRNDGDAEIEKAYDALHNKLSSLTDDVYSIEQKANSGVYLTLHWGGEPNFTFGLYAAEDAGSGATSKNGSPAEKPLHTAKLSSDLTAQRTLALQKEVMQDSRAALILVVHKMLLTEGYSGWGNSNFSCLNLSLQPTSFHQKLIDPENNIKQQLEAARTVHWETLPENPADLWDWCAKRTVDELLTLMAAAVSGSLDAIHDGLPASYSNPRVLHADQVATEVKLDMGVYFKPTAESYFKHVSKNTAEIAIGEACNDEALTRLNAAKKKSERSAMAEKLVAKSTWLPEPLRTNINVNQENVPVPAHE